MSISKRTADVIVKTIVLWGKVYEVDMEKIKHLFAALSCIQGNKSFKDSISMVIDELVREEHQNVRVVGSEN